MAHSMQSDMQLQLDINLLPDRKMIVYSWKTICVCILFSVVKNKNEKEITSDFIKLLENLGFYLKDKDGYSLYNVLS